MNSDTATAELLVQYTDGADGRDEEVRRALERSFGIILAHSGGSNRSVKQPGAPARTGLAFAANPEAVADSLAGIIFSFSRVAAAGGAPDGSAVSEIRTAILEFVQRHVPIEVQLLWSPKKHWTMGTENAVDLAELAAFQTLISIDAAVRPIYRVGLSFRIDLEDIEFQFMEGQNEEVVTAQDTYISGLSHLRKALGLNELFTLRRISEHAKDADELGRWRQQMAENYRVLEAYWHESEECPASSWATLGSFKELRRLGWKGVISSEMRRYYLDRLRKLTGASEAKKVNMVLSNLAGILLHHQVGLLGGSGGIRPLKLSFVRSADGAPAELLQRRVDVRFAPRALCSRVSAAGPWATKGFVCRRGKEAHVSFRGWHDLASARCRFAEGSLAIVGPNGTARVRADLIRED
ncbi:MAG TPA: hypothetical protein VGM62_12785 [Chthoniobacterales bacterium]